jgi:hypothetical protein
MEWIERLQTALSGDGTEMVPDVATGRFLITSYFGRKQEPPLVLHLTEPEFRAHLKSIGTGASPVFPGDTVMEAGYKLFLVHMDEKIATREPAETELRLISGDLETVRPGAVESRTSKPVLPPDPAPRRHWALDDPHA